MPWLGVMWHQDFFGAGKRTVWNQVHKSTEPQSFLTQLLPENLSKFLIEYIY